MKQIIVLALLLFVFGESTCNASWLVFHKQEIKGKIVDIETHEPIEGAVVVAVYRVHSLAVADSVDYDIGAQEALTDKSGEFRIPSYTTMIQPFSLSIPTEFIYFKPGYVCDGAFGREEDYSADRTLTDREFSASWNRDLKYKISKDGIVMLRKVEGKDRIESSSKTSRISQFRNTLPIVYMIDKTENKYILDLQRRRVE